MHTTSTTIATKIPGFKIQMPATENCGNKSGQ